MKKLGIDELLEENERIEKETNKIFLWNGMYYYKEILYNMGREAKKYNSAWGKRAFFIAFRLKFADEKTIFLMQEALINGNKHYTETINGLDTIYETMRLYNCDYYNALFIQYSETQHAKDSKYLCYDPLPTVNINETEYVSHSILSEDGTEIIHLKAEEFKKLFGPDLINVDDYSPKEVESYIKFRKKNKLGYALRTEKYKNFTAEEYNLLEKAFRNPRKTKYDEIRKKFFNNIF